MEMQKSKVYVLPDSSGYITRIDGGYTIGNIKDFTGWVLIDEGYGDRFNLCQGNYFPQPIITMGGAYRYKLADGKPVERTQEEMDADYIEPKQIPTQNDIIEAQVTYTAMMTDTLLEV